MHSKKHPSTTYRNYPNNGTEGGQGGGGSGSYQMRMGGPPPDHHKPNQPLPPQHSQSQPNQPPHILTGAETYDAHFNQEIPSYSNKLGELSTGVPPGAMYSQQRINSNPSSANRPQHAHSMHYLPSNRGSSMRSQQTRPPQQMIYSPQYLAGVPQQVFFGHMNQIPTIPSMGIAPRTQVAPMSGGSGGGLAGNQALSGNPGGAGAPSQGHYSAPQNQGFIIPQATQPAGPAAYLYYTTPYYQSIQTHPPYRFPLPHGPVAHTQQPQPPTTMINSAPSASGMILPGGAPMHMINTQERPKNKEFKNAIPILDPNTNENVIERMRLEDGSSNSSDAGGKSADESNSNIQSAKVAAEFVASTMVEEQADSSEESIANGPTVSSATSLVMPPEVPSLRNHQEPKLPLISDSTKETPVVSANINTPAIDVHHVHHSKTFRAPQSPQKPSRASQGKNQEPYACPPRYFKDYFRIQFPEITGKSNLQPVSSQDVSKVQRKTIEKSAVRDDRKVPSVQPILSQSFEMSQLNKDGSPVPEFVPAAKSKSERAPPATSSSPPQSFSEQRQSPTSQLSEASSKTVSAPSVRESSITPPPVAPSSTTDDKYGDARIDSSDANELMESKRSKHRRSSTTGSKNASRNSSLNRSGQGQQSTVQQLRRGSQDGSHGTHDVPQSPSKTTQQRSKHKKPKRDINKKGNEKEGTDMDAFTDILNNEMKVPPARSETPARSDTPTSIGDRSAELSRGGTPTAMEEPAAVPSPSPPPAPVVESTTSSTPPPIAQQPTSLSHDPQPSPPKSPEPQALITPQTQAPTQPGEDEEDSSRVAAKNEANSKLSTAQQNGEKAPTEENEIIPATVITRSQPPPAQPKFSYKEGYWSPDNQEGKKIYDKTLLLELRGTPLSNNKPQLDQELEILINKKDNSSGMNNKRMATSTYSLPARQSGGFFPDFGPNNSPRGPPRGGRASSRLINNNNSRNSSKIMYNTLSRQDSSNKKVWKPYLFKNDAEGKSPEEVENEKLYKKFRGILNKLTPEKFEKLVSQVRLLPISSHERLKGVVNLVFEKAVDEPSFSKSYAELCKIISNHQVNVSTPNAPEGQAAEAAKQESTMTFRKLLVTRCQEEFEKNKQAELDVEKRLTEINSCKDPEKKKELQVLFDEAERKIRVRKVGLVRFIGELYKLNQLTANIMHSCVQTLIVQVDEESLECLCKLLTTIGKDLDNKRNDKDGQMNHYFNNMKKLAEKRPDSKVSSRVRFMLQDVIELRQKKWVPRRDDNNPKTIEEIHIEAQKEAAETQAALLAASSRKPDNRDRRMPKSSDDNWSTPIGGKTTSTRYPIDSSKLSQFKNSEHSGDQRLGSANIFRWGNTTTKPGGVDVVTPNRFSVLTNLSKPPPISQERDRAMGGIADAYNRSAPVSSGPSSRDASLQRHVPPESVPEPAPENTYVSGSDTFVRKCKTILSEYINNKNLEETVSTIVESFHGPVLESYVKDNILHHTDTKKEETLQFVDIVVGLAKKNMVKSDVIVAGFADVYREVDDLIIDIPNILVVLAEMMVPMMVKEVISFEDIKTVTKPFTSSDRINIALKEVLVLLTKQADPYWVKHKWEANKWKLEDFNIRSDPDTYFKTHGLAFMVEKEVPAGHDESMTFERIETKIYDLLLSNDPHAFERACSWITYFCSKLVSEPKFTCALTRAVLRFSHKEKKIDLDLFKKYDKLLKRYLNGDSALELECLYEIQHYFYSVDVPISALVDIFQKLSENTISKATFLKWRESKHENEKQYEGKVVAITALKSFFDNLDNLGDDSEDQGEDDTGEGLPDEDSS